MKKSFLSILKIKNLIALALLMLTLVFLYGENEKSQLAFETSEELDIEMLDGKKEKYNSNISLQRIYSNCAKNPALLFLLNNKLLQQLHQALLKTTYSHSLFYISNQVEKNSFFTISQKIISSDDDDLSSFLG